MAMLEPRLCILDETDSGLDIDALRTVADGVNALRDPSARHDRDHPLSAPARLHRARPGARAGLRPDPALRRQGAGAASSRQAAMPACSAPSSPSSGRGPEAMASARTRDRAAAGLRCRRSPTCEGQLPGPRSARLAAGMLRPLRRAGHPDQPGRGLEVHQRRQGGQRAAGAGAQGRDRPGRDQPPISWAATRRGG